MQREDLGMIGGYFTAFFMPLVIAISALWRLSSWMKRTDRRGELQSEILAGMLELLTPPPMNGRSVSSLELDYRQRLFMLTGKAEELERIGKKPLRTGETA